MDVGKRPSDVAKAIRDFRNAAAHGNHDAAMVQLTELSTMLTEDDPFWVTAEHIKARLERNR